MVWGEVPLRRWRIELGETNEDKIDSIVYFPSYRGPSQNATCAAAAVGEKIGISEFFLIELISFIIFFVSVWDTDWSELLGLS